MLFTGLWTSWGFCTSAPVGTYNGLEPAVLAVFMVRTLPISLPNWLLVLENCEDRVVTRLSMLGAGRIMMEPLVVSSSGIWYMLLRVWGLRFCRKRRYNKTPRVISNGSPTPHPVPINALVGYNPSPGVAGAVTVVVAPATPDAIACPTKSCIWAGRRTSLVSVETAHVVELSWHWLLSRPHTNVLLLKPALHGVMATSPSALTVQDIYQT